MIEGNKEVLMENRVGADSLRENEAQTIRVLPKACYGNDITTANRYQMLLRGGPTKISNSNKSKLAS